MQAFVIWSNITRLLVSNKKSLLVEFEKRIRDSKLICVIRSWNSFTNAAFDFGNQVKISFLRKFTRFMFIRWLAAHKESIKSRFKQTYDVEISRKLSVQGSYPGSFSNTVRIDSTLTIRSDSELEKSSNASSCLVLQRWKYLIPRVAHFVRKLGDILIEWKYLISLGLDFRFTFKRIFYTNITRYAIVQWNLISLNENYYGARTANVTGPELGGYLDGAPVCNFVSQNNEQPVLSDEKLT